MFVSSLQYSVFLSIIPKVITCEGLSTHSLGIFLIVFLIVFLTSSDLDRHTSDSPIPQRKVSLPVHMLGS